MTVDSRYYSLVVVLRLTTQSRTTSLLVRRWTMFRVSSEASLFGGAKPRHVLQGRCLHVEPAKQSWLATIPWCLGWDRSCLVLTGHCLVEITPFRWLYQTKTNGQHYHFISQEGGSRWGRVVSLTIGPTSRLGLACPHRYKTKTHPHTHCSLLV
jgi:hypothetical protein